MQIKIGTVVSDALMGKNDLLVSYRMKVVRSQVGLSIVKVSIILQEQGQSTITLHVLRGLDGCQGIWSY